VRQQALVDILKSDPAVDLHQLYRRSLGPNLPTANYTAGCFITLLKPAMNERDLARDCRDLHHSFQSTFSVSAVSQDTEKREG